MSYIDFLKEYGHRFWDGTLVTAEQFFLATLLAICIALLAGLMKLSRNRLIRGVAVVYIEFFRGTSLLVQLYWIFFVLPLFGLTFEKSPHALWPWGLLWAPMGPYWCAGASIGSQRAMGSR